MSGTFIGVMGGITEGSVDRKEYCLLGIWRDGGVILPLRHIGVMGEILSLEAAEVMGERYCP